MAGIFEDYISCSECGGTDFDINKTTKIRSEAAKMSRGEDEYYPDRFAEDVKIIYKCAQCGTELKATKK